MNTKGFTRDEKAVSETLGYIIIFGIVFTCIGILVVSGNQIISNTEDRTMLQGIEQSFNVLASDIRKTAFDASPMRTLQIRYDGSMQFSNSNFKLLTTYSDDTAIPGSALGGIEFYSSRTDQSISLENNAVIKNSAMFMDSSIMTQLPRIYVAETEENAVKKKTLVVTAIKLTGPDSSIGGQGIADIRMSFVSLHPGDRIPLGDKTVKIKVKTDNQNAWENYFRNELTVTPTDESGWVVATLTNIDYVQVIEYDINVDMD